MNDGLDRMTDEELSRLAQEGSDEAAGCLIARYLPLAAARAAGYYGPGLEQDDLIQEGLVGIWNAVRRYDPARGGSFQAFAAQCVSNRVFSAVRAALSPRQAPLRDYMSISSDADGRAVQLPSGEEPEASFIRKEDTELRSRRMRRLLSQREQAVLELYLLGHSYQEISERLGISPKAVDNALQRVRKKLQAV